MRKSFLFFSTVLFALVALSTVSYAQSRKEQRRVEQQAIDNKTAEAITSGVETRNISFIATELTATSDPMITDVQLNAVWGLYITPNRLRSYLPVYGAKNASYRPSMIRRMDFSTSDYTWNAEKTKFGWDVTIKVSEPSTNTAYTMYLTVPTTGRNATLSISTSFDPSITYSGYIQVD